MSTVLV